MSYEPKTDWVDYDPLNPSNPNAIPTAADMIRIEEGINDAYNGTGTFGTTTNISNAYSLTFTNPFTSLPTGLKITFKCNADSSGNTTLNIDGLGAKSIKNSNGENVTELKNGGIYTVVYDGTNFIQQGEGGVGSFFGSGSDGVLNTTGNLTLTSTLNGGAVVKEYESITINAGNTLTVSNPCQGLILYSKGDVVINGTIDMSQKAGIAPNGNIIPMLITKVKSNLTTKTLEKYYQLTTILESIIGGSGGNGGYGGGYDGSTGRSSGGTAGSGRQNLGGFGGGGGGGGAGNQAGANGGSIYHRECLGYPTKYSVNGYSTYSETSSPGVGGHGSFSRTTPANATLSENGIPRGAGSGGAGGNWASSGNNTFTGSNVSEYCGGFILIIAGGNINIAGTIRCNGGNGSNGTDVTSAASGTNQKAGGGGGGGGAGGGCIMLVHAGTLTNNGTIQVNGGSGGSGGTGLFSENGGSGASGSAGTILTQKL